MIIPDDCMKWWKGEPARIAACLVNQTNGDTTDWTTELSFHHDTLLSSPLLETDQTCLCGQSQDNLRVRTCGRKLYPLKERKNQQRSMQFCLESDRPSMYDGCLKVATWMSAKRHFARSLSEAPIRVCNRFFVSENFSPCGSER